MQASVTKEGAKAIINLRGVSISIPIENSAGLMSLWWLMQLSARW